MLTGCLAQRQRISMLEGHFHRQTKTMLDATISMLKPTEHSLSMLDTLMSMPDAGSIVNSYISSTMVDSALNIFDNAGLYAEFAATS